MICLRLPAILRREIYNYRTSGESAAGGLWVRQPALRALFDACHARTAAPLQEPPTPRPADEIIHPWLIRLCSVFLDQGMAYWPMPHRERGFYQCVRTLFSRRGGIFPRYLDGLDEEFRRQQALSFSAEDAVLDYLDARRSTQAGWEEALQAELLALPGWAGLMRRLEENPGLAPHESLALLPDGLSCRTPHHVPRGLARRRR